MSYRYFRRSGCIKQHPRLVHTAQEIGIVDGGDFHEIDVAVKQVFQRKQQPEIRIGMVAGRHGLELDEKIEIAGLGLELAACRRAEKLQLPDGIPAAELLQSGTVGFNQRIHFLSINQKRRMSTHRTTRVEQAVTTDFSARSLP